MSLHMLLVSFKARNSCELPQHSVWNKHISYDAKCSIWIGTRQGSLDILRACALHRHACSTHSQKSTTGNDLVQCRMQKKQPEIVFGPPIHFREYSLLDNPRMPAAVKSSELQIRTCQVGRPNLSLILTFPCQSLFFILSMAAYKRCMYNDLASYPESEESS